MDVDAVLRRQDGVISLRQAVAAGLSERGVRNRVARGKWQRIHRRVYAADPATALTDAARIRAAALWAAPRAAVSGLAAAWWHGLVDSCPDDVEVTIARDRRPDGTTGVRVRRRPLADADLVQVRHIWLTAVPLTVLEAATALGIEGPAFLDQALQRQVRFPTVYRAHCRNLGRHGSRAAAALLGAAADRAESAAERLLLKILRAAGITGWRLGYVVVGYRLDLAFPRAMVAVEVDGWAWHQGADRFRADRRRQNALVLGGWTVLRFTWDDLIHRPDTVVQQIRATLTGVRTAIS